MSAHYVKHPFSGKSTVRYGAYTASCECQL